MYNTHKNQKECINQVVPFLEFLEGESGALHFFAISCFFGAVCGGASMRICAALRSATKVFTTSFKLLADAEMIHGCLCIY